MITDEEIGQYVDKYYLENEITHIESRLLCVLKLRQEKYPCDKNDADWMSFSDWVINRKNESVTKQHRLRE